MRALVMGLMVLLLVAGEERSWLTKDEKKPAYEAQAGEPKREDYQSDDAWLTALNAWRTAHPAPKPAASPTPAPSPSDGVLLWEKKDTPRPTPPPPLGPGSYRLPQRKQKPKSA
jgi:hypothetical protein